MTAPDQQGKDGAKYNDAFEMVPTMGGLAKAMQNVTNFQMASAEDNGQDNKSFDNKEAV